MPPKLTVAQLNGYAPTMVELAHDDIVYLAALIDGEGSIAYRAHPGRPFAYASIHVYNTHRPLMDWLVTLGGGVSQRAPRTATTGPVGRKVMYCWVVTRQQDVAYLLRVLKPHFRIKGARAEQVLADLSQERVWNTERWSPPVWRGESSPNAKLTEVQVRAIRESQASTRSLALALGVSRRTIGRARSGEAWAHVEPQHPDTVH